MEDRVKGEPINRAAAIVFLVLGLFTLLSGIVGNWFLLFVLASQRKLRKLHNIFIANLALADLVVVFTGLPFLLLDLLLDYHPVVNEFHCRMNGFVLCLAYSVSILSLVSISFNRYMKVCHTSRFHALFSLRKNVLYCLGLWVVGCLFQTSLLAGYPPYGYDAGSHLCQARAVRDEINSGGMGMFVLLAGPVALTGYFNYAIFHKWSESRAKVKGNVTTAKPGGAEMKPGPPGNLKSSSSVRSMSDMMSSDIIEPKSVTVTNMTSVDAEVDTNSSDTDTDLAELKNKQKNLDEKKALGSMFVGAGPKGRLQHPSNRTKFNMKTFHSYTLPSVSTDPNATGQKYFESSRVQKNSSQSRKNTSSLTRARSLPTIESLDSHTRKDSPDHGRKFLSPAHTRKTLAAFAPEYFFADDRNNDITLCSVSNLPSADTSSDNLMFNSDKDSIPKTSQSESTTKTDNYKKQNKSRNKTPGFTEKSRAEVALIRSLLVISICLLALYTPFAACLLADYGTDLPSELMVFASLLLFVNCAINWVIYGVMNTSFRQGYARALRRLKSSCFRCSKQKSKPHAEKPQDRQCWP